MVLAFHYYYSFSLSLTKESLLGFICLDFEISISHITSDVVEMDMSNVGY